MKKIRSYGFWTALSGAVVLFLKALGDICGFSIQDDLVSGIIMAFAGILVVFGVVNMPQKEDEKEGDPKEDEDNENGEAENSDGDEKQENNNDEDLKQ